MALSDVLMCLFALPITPLTAFQVSIIINTLGKNCDKNRLFAFIIKSPVENTSTINPHYYLFGCVDWGRSGPI